MSLGWIYLYRSIAFLVGATTVFLFPLPWTLRELSIVVGIGGALVLIGAMLDYFKARSISHV